MRENLKSWFTNGNYFYFEEYKIFYNQFGIGEDVIIIHGYPYSSYEWKYFISLCSNHFKVTVFDLLGFGFSDKPENHEYSFHEFASILNQLALNLNIKQAHLIANDFGVSVVQEVLAKSQEDEIYFSINSICFSNGNLFSDVYNPTVFQRILFYSPSFIGNFLNKNIKKSFLLHATKKLYGKYSQPSKEFLEELWETLFYQNGKNISFKLGKLMYNNEIFNERWYKALKDSKIPLCYICGPADISSGFEMGIAFKKRVTSGTLIWMDDHIGHWPMIEDSYSFFICFLNWIKRNKNIKNKN